MDIDITIDNLLADLEPENPHKDSAIQDLETLTSQTDHLENSADIDDQIDLVVNALIDYDWTGAYQEAEKLGKLLP